MFIAFQRCLLSVLQQFNNSKKYSSQYVSDLYLICICMFLSELRYENRSPRSPVRRKTGLEMPGIPVQNGYGSTQNFGLSLGRVTMSRCEGSSLHFHFFGLLFSQKAQVVFSKDTCQGKTSLARRVERVEEMEETVETVQGLRDGIQVHSSFHTDVKDLEYKDLLTSTLTLEGHEKLGVKRWLSSSPQCVFCGHSYRYSIDRVECHMDPTINKESSGPTINKESSGKKRTVRSCAVSVHTTRGPL